MSSTKGPIVGVSPLDQPLGNHPYITLSPLLKRRGQKWYIVSKIALTYCEKNCSIDLEKVLKFEAEVRDFSNILRLLEQFIPTEKIIRI